MKNILFNSTSAERIFDEAGNLSFPIALENILFMFEGVIRTASRRY